MVKKTSRPTAERSSRMPVHAAPSRKPLSMSPATIRLLGCLSIFTSAFFLYLSTLVIRWSEPDAVIPSSYFVFARFLIGFIVVSCVMLTRRIRLGLYRPHLLVGRAITNCISVFCFYKAVSTTTVAEANILNMTYPLFVGLFAWLYLKDQRDLRGTLTLGVAFAGIYMVLAPASIQGYTGNWWGLFSGIFGAAAIIYLNVSRQYHDTYTILFFLFGLGSLGIVLLFRRHFFWPGPTEAYYLILCGTLGVAGQYFLTLGFRYVTAVEGSVISSARILLAAMLGPILASDPSLSLSGWMGALLILASNVYLAFRKMDRLPVRSL